MVSLDSLKAQGKLSFLGITVAQCHCNLCKWLQITNITEMSSANYRVLQRYGLFQTSNFACVELTNIPTW